MHASQLRTGALVILTVTLTQAAELKRETLDAWRGYIAQETQQVKQRASTRRAFLWVDAEPNRYQQIRAGQVVVAPIGDHNPNRIPGGLIHHWIGAIFIPDASIDDVLAITRDYKHYKDFYKPGVADASASTLSPTQDKFTVTFVNASVLARTSLIGTYVSNLTRIDQRHFYSTSETTSMCEVRNLGCPNEKILPARSGQRIHLEALQHRQNGGS